MYSHHGFNDFVVCLGYRGSQIKEYFLNYDAMNADFTITLGKQSAIAFHDGHTEDDVRVTLAETGAETGTGGRVKRVARYLHDETFMVTYGDGVSDIDLTRLLEYHRSHGRLATVSAVRPPSRFGQLQLAEDGSVLEFREKPVLDDWISAGFFVFEPRVLDYLDGESPLERGPLERLAADRQLMAYYHDGFWQAMDTYREAQLLNELWASGEPPWKTW